MIEAVTFDFWNTIARVPPGMMTAARQRAIARACEELEIELEAAALARGLEEVGNSWESAWAEGRHLHPRDSAAALAQALEVGEEAEAAVAEAFLGAAREVSLDLAPDIRPALEALVERGIKVGIVCDVGFSGGEMLRDHLRREDLLGHFSGWAFSDEVGHYKPSPRIFEAALGSLRARPEASLHVGDLRRTDIAGAAAFGMRTARYRGIHDDADLQSGVEADVVIDSHLELIDAIEQS